MSQPSLARNPLSLFGASLATVGAFTFLIYYTLDSFALLPSPYSGLFGFLFVPAIFSLGLLLIPIGIWREHRRRQRGAGPWVWPSVDLGQHRTSQVVLAVFVLTLVNLAIVAVAGVGAVHYMETDKFCGQACHVPMRPEFTAHQQAPHASVACVQCHVSPGAAGTVRAKLNGTRQAYELIRGTFARPIGSPARNIPVAADTCMRCHAAGYPSRDITRVKAEYGDDATNTESSTTMVLFTGKIHWHARPDTRVDYVATGPKRDTIPYVRVTAADGTVTEYFAPTVTSKPDGPLRRMDCLDCHTRPAHAFSASAERAVDEVIASGQISRGLPFVRRETIAALKAEYANDAAAAEGIRRRLTDFYQPSDASRGVAVAQAVTTAQRLYRLNVFPDMRVTWGTYQTELGHTDRPGCFRCHDADHKTRDGTAIRQECELCHRVQ